jgi:hypothetical protein
MGVGELPRLAGSFRSNYLVALSGVTAAIVRRRDVA